MLTRPYATAQPCPPWHEVTVHAGPSGVRWLVASAAIDPDLAAGIPPRQMLAAEEEARLASLSVAKRRRDWLLGRATAKALLQNWLAHHHGAAPFASSIVIETEPNGAPYARLTAAERLPVSLSISHCNGHAFCALISAPFGVPVVGADIEKIEPRAWAFVEDYFTPWEIDQVCRAPDAERDALITAIWSVKEAVLKAVQRGLTVDTRAVDCDLGGRAASDDWQPVSVRWDQRLDVPDGTSITAHWRRWGAYVLTLARLDTP